MWTYVLRRGLILIPTIFVISIINFGIINFAPPPRSSNVRESGDLDTSKSIEANEGEHIFRQTFFLDKPRFFNTRYDLEDREILWLVTSPQRDYDLPPARKRYFKDLDDYGRLIVPHLLRIATAAITNREELRNGALGESYRQRWREERNDWVAAGKPPGEIVWPPPAEAPPFEDAFLDRLASLVLSRLANNAPRRPRVGLGREMTEADQAYNREVRDEHTRLRKIYLDTRTSDATKLAAWQAWHDERAGEWEYSTGDKVHMFLLETRFARFWRNLATFDLGTSFIHKKPVWDLILERLPVSLTLSFGSLVLAYLIGIPLGIFSAVTHRSWSDAFISFVLFALYALPTIFLGILLRKYFTIDWKLLPGAGFHGSGFGRLTVLGKLADVARHAALPLLTLTVGYLAYYSRFMKAGLIDIIRSDFVRTARAKGLSEFVVVVKHATRNGLIPIITLLGASLPVLIGGSIVVEVIFEIDGMGKFAYEAVRTNDFAVIMGINILVAVLTLVGVFLADLAYAIVDPRISYR